MTSTATNGGGVAVVLDRDGTINELVLNPRVGLHESPYKRADVVIRPDVTAELAVLSALGVQLYVVSNQPAAAKGEASLDDLINVHQEVDALLHAGGVSITRYVYCPHHPAGRGVLGRRCGCRKPEPGMFRALESDSRYATAGQRWCVGDSDVDMIAGRRAGLRTVLVENPDSAHRRHGDERPDITTSTTIDALTIISGQIGHLRVR